MLIASMGNTYQRVISVSEKERVRQWAQLVLTIERSCAPKQRFDYQGVYAIGSDDKRDLMVIKRATKSKAAQRKGAMTNWKKLGRTVLYFLKDQKATAENVRLRRLSHQSVVYKQKPQFDDMLETIVWEHDIDLSASKGLNSSNPNLNLGSTQNTAELYCSMSRPPSPPPPQLVMGGFPAPSSIPQRITGDQKPLRRSELSEIRSRPSFIDYEDLEVFRHMHSIVRTPSGQHVQSARRVSRVPVDADGYRDLLSDMDSSEREDSKRTKSKRFVPRGTSNTSIKSKISETTLC